MNLQTELRQVPEYLSGHLLLCLWALGIGTSVGVGLGIVCLRRPWWRRGLLFLTQLVQTVPSLALLAAMVPLFALLGNYSQNWFGFHLSSIGFYPAVTALTLYSILPILRNTLLGLDSVDESLREAAAGVGMTARQQLWQVELPLALPFIMGGIRTAAVWVVGMAVLSTPVGAPSLGNFIFSGLQTRNNVAVLVGCCCAALTAQTFDSILWALAVLLQQQRTRRVLALVCSVAMLILAVWSPWPQLLSGQSVSNFLIGAKPFTEQYLLASMLEQHLHHRLKLPSHRLESLGSNMAFEALTHQELDCYVEYNGFITQVLLHGQFNHLSPKQQRAEVTKYLAKQGIVIAATLGFDNSYVLAWQAPSSQSVNSLASMADLAPKLRLGGDYEFFERPEWPKLQTIYNLHFVSTRAMDPSLLYQAIAHHEVDIITAYNTDGRLAADHLVVLKDPNYVIPNYDALVLLQAKHQKNLKITQALAELDHRISVVSMRRLNFAIDAQHQDINTTAADFLRQHIW